VPATSPRIHNGKKLGVLLYGWLSRSRPSWGPGRDDTERHVTTRDESSRPGGHGAGGAGGLKSGAERFLPLWVCWLVVDTGETLC